MMYIINTILKKSLNFWETNYTELNSSFPAKESNQKFDSSLKSESKFKMHTQFLNRKSLLTPKRDLTSVIPVQISKWVNINIVKKNILIIMLIN